MQVKEKQRQWPGFFQALAKGLGAFAAHQGIRVFTFRHHQKADIHAIGQLRQTVIEGLAGGFKTGAVAIEAEHDILALPKQVADAFLVGGRTQGGHPVVDAELGQRYHIHIAFHHHQL